jgi:acyl-CoA thioesterase FadM
MDLLNQFGIVCATSPENVNFGGHIGEEVFFDFFKKAKDSWIFEILATNQLSDIHFATRKYAMQIHSEVFYPSELHVFVHSVSFEGYRISLVFLMKSKDKFCARAEFELIPVSLKERKMISKSMLNENYSSKINPLFI